MKKPCLLEVWGLRTVGPPSSATACWYEDLEARISIPGTVQEVESQEKPDRLISQALHLTPSQVDVL